MIRTLSILLLAITLTGCDPVSRTEIDVQPNPNTHTELAREEVIDITSKIAAKFGLEESDRRETDTSFTDTLSRLGQNPDIWLTVKHAPDPNAIEITEMFIEHPTEKHTQLANSLIQELNASGYDTAVVYQTPAARNWSWLYVTIAVVISAFVGWRIFGHRKNKTSEIAT